MIYLRLFWNFFKTGLFSIGGGLATLPFLYEMSDLTHWFTHADIADMIAISESTPGAIGINMSTYAGYMTGGLLGGLTATIGLACPSVIIILLICRFLEKFRDSRYVQKAFYGLRPASIAMISAAGINVVKVTLVDLPALTQDHNPVGALNLPQILLAVLLFLGMKKLKWHPIVFLVLSGMIGAVFHFGGV